MKLPDSHLPYCKESQFDTRIRVMDINNLIAILYKHSGVCHRYYIAALTEHFCYVGYSNPDEYGYEQPVYGKFPCWFENDRCYVAINILDTNKIPKMYGEEWQAFSWIEMTDPLWRASKDSQEWKTREQIEKEKTS